MHAKATALFEPHPEACFLDIEVAADGTVHSAGVWGRALDARVRGKQVETVLRELDERLASPGALLCGHNIADHDVPIIRERYPRFMNIARAPVLDSLFLSPLAFPKRPYHALVKDRDLIARGNDPLKDCKASGVVLADALRVFGDRRRQADPDFRTIIGLLRTGAWPPNARDGLDALFEGGAPTLPDSADTLCFKESAALRDTRVCPVHRHGILEETRDNPAVRTALAYVMAWLPLAGSDSIPPIWVWKRFPETERVVRRLRGQCCDDPACPYCTRAHNPTEQLRKWFGFPAFRPEPTLPGDPARGLQETIVRAGMNGESLLGILPTGGGKSLCFQIPALCHYAATGALTIVVSPLQALMKDQVENLVQRSGIHSTAALYGLLTMAERRVLLDEIAQGAIGLLYVSPEQLRNRSFHRAVLRRRIAAWVYDEAHCLSKWGHDFRPDYLYVARFIRELAEEQAVPPPAVCCVTATAKGDVRAEIREHIASEVGHALRVFDGGAERPNLSYVVEETEETPKEDRIHDILTEHIGPRAGKGCAVVFCATRKSAERTAERLQRRGWAADRFHAGLDNDEKKRVFDAFMSDRTRVIVATNAFGMGVDKPDIRVVIHAETPGSLENYLQEAGRAGRDGAPAECVLLFDRKDIETQFRLSGHSRLHLEDIQAIWRAIRRADRKRAGEVVLTAEEILNNVDGGREGANPLESTGVRTAIALLEKQGFLQRDENRAVVFQARALVKTLDEGLRKIDRLDLAPPRAALWKAYLTVFFDIQGDDACGLDPFAELALTAEAHAACEAGTRRSISVYRFVVNTLNEMASPGVGLLRKDLLFSAWLKCGKQSNARATLRSLAGAENTFLGLLRELQPDADHWTPCHLRALNQRLSDEGTACAVETLARLLQQWERDPRQLQSARPNIEIQHHGTDHYRVRVLTTWSEVADAARMRQAHLAVMVDHLLADPPQGASDAFVEFSERELLEAFAADTELRGHPPANPGNAILGLLDFAHRQGILDLQNGKALISSAMTLRLNPDKIRRKRAAGFTKGDYAPLRAFYEERILQIHVVAEYARTATRKIAAHIGLIADYFRLSKTEFARRHLTEDQDLYRRATGIESFRQIVEDLGNPTQQAIVAASTQTNRIVLAGPGAGKTRVIVHRCGYLLRVERLRPRNLLVLCFNRNACLELRRRIFALIGEDAYGVIITTYHGLALRLLGRSLADPRGARANSGSIDFKALLREATAWLRGEGNPITGADPENLRERLTGDIRHILIDEYQDIDEDEYALIRALSGADLPEGESHRPTLLAVGDDDQAIYGFKGANVAFIRRFCSDYAAGESFLVENHRSSGHIIEAGNRLIARNRDRMKTEHPIRVDRRRRAEAPGGRWKRLDAVARGRVQCLVAEDPAHQALAILNEITRLREIADTPWNHFAVLARINRDLHPLRALLDERGIPHRFDATAGEVPALTRVRPIAAWLDHMREHRDEAWPPATARERLLSLLGEPTDPWTRLLDSIAREFHGEAGEQTTPVPEIAAFFHDALAEHRRQGLPGDGIQLLTIHRAKGLEFEHVFLADGAWPRLDRFHPRHETEEERRVYYVGLTRARESLALFDSTRNPNRFARETDGPGLFRRAAPHATPETGARWPHRQFQILPPTHLFLGYAGLFPPNHPIHQNLAVLRCGDVLRLVPSNGRLWLRDTSGRNIARLSREGARIWAGRVHAIREIRVLAMIRRHRDDGDARFRDRAQTETWEYPFAEAILQPDGPDPV